uniref:Uncharacterized protein n=1 Tax=Anguilla anguilla TaxID=7936 RepID=A0A0E9XTL9_ANGAN
MHFYFIFFTLNNGHSAGALIQSDLHRFCICYLVLFLYSWIYTEAM